MEKLTCGRCGRARETTDNFCRQCGHQFTVNLPSVRQSSLPVRSKGLPPSLVGSVAVLAVGTGLEWLARRMAGSAARAAGRALVSTDRPQQTQVTQPTEPPEVTIDEVVYVRKVHVRR